MQRLQIALSRRAEALAEDCMHAQVLISVAPAQCKGPALLIDQRKAEDGQGWAIRLSPLAATSVRAARGDRPWVAKINTAE